MEGPLLHRCGDMPCPWVLWGRGPGWWEQELSPGGWEPGVDPAHPSGRFFPHQEGVRSCARADGHSPSGAVFPWARPRELRPLGLPGPPPPSPVSPAQSCPGSASVCPPVPRPGNSRCELEPSAGRLVSRLRITVFCCSMSSVLEILSSCLQLFSQLDR